MTIKQYYRINRKLFRNEKRPLVPFIFLGLGIVLLLLSYHTGSGYKKELLDEYENSPLSGVILAEPEDGTAINDSVVSKISSVKGIKGATGIYEFQAEIGYGTSNTSVTVWAIERKHIADMDLRYISVSEDSMTAQLPLIINTDTVKQLGGTVTVGDRLSVRIQESDQMNAEVAAVTDITGAGTHIKDQLKGKVITGLEDAESLMQLLFEHQSWPGQDTAISSADHGRMKYRYVIAFAKDPKKMAETVNTLEGIGYRCISEIEDISEKTEKNRPLSLGFLLSGSAFMLCAVYLILQMKNQRLERCQVKIGILEDFGWKEAEIKRLLLFDFSALIISLSVCAVTIEIIMSCVF